MEKEVTDWLERTVKEFFAGWPLKPHLSFKEDDQALIMQINTGQDLIFTQPSAQPLLAAQHLLRMIFKKEFPDYPKKLLVDIGDFRERQLSAIDQVVQEAIWQTKASGNPVHLSPMSSFERRLVHMRIAAESDLSSESMGSGLDRHVVIRLNAK